MQPSGKTMIDSPEAVRAAYAAGKITRDQAKQLLTSNFGMK